MTVAFHKRTSAEPATSSPAPQSRDPSRLLEREVRFGAAVYGSFLVASVIGVGYESGAGARAITVSLFGSMLVFWTAHVWSEVVGERIHRGKAFGPRNVLFIARREWPLVEAGALPSVLLALSLAGAWSRETGVRIALGAAIVQVVAWGFAAGKRTGVGTPTAVALAVGEGLVAALLLAAERLVR